MNELPGFIERKIAVIGIRPSDIVRWTAIPIIRSTRGRKQLEQSMITLYLAGDRRYEWEHKWGR